MTTPLQRKGLGKKGKQFQIDIFIRNKSCFGIVQKLLKKKKVIFDFSGKISSFFGSSEAFNDYSSSTKRTWKKRKTVLDRYFYKE